MSREVSQCARTLPQAPESLIYVRGERGDPGGPHGTCAMPPRAKYSSGAITRNATEKPHPMSALEYHVLLALASGPLHGYAVKDAVVAESSGALVPRAGSL